MQIDIQLFGPGSVAFHVAALDRPAFDALLKELATAHPGAALCRMSGEASRTETGFFDEVGRAMKIPYESISWNVLNEALHDLTWMPANGYVLAVDNGDQLLVDAQPTALQTLGEILDAVSESHLASHPPPAPRTVLLHTPPRAVADLTARLSTAGLRFEVRAALH